jgi:predicted MFS family arabinose efflux permease
VLPHNNTATTTDSGDGYLVSKRQAWFAFAMTFGLMLFDYIDRQVIVSLFPHIKAEWSLSDAQLGALVSIISVVVGVGGIPVALLADRLSRVKSIVVMATTWSLATIGCMFAGNYGQLLVARAVVGAGETGYGSVGAALISALFPRRLRGALMGAFFAAGSLGAVLGVVLGGVIAAKWGWKMAFGVVGFPGLVLALLYLLVRDYKTVNLADSGQPTALVTLLARIFGTLGRTRTLLWVCVGAALQLIVVSAVWSWLPSYLNRFYGVAPDVAAKQAALVVLMGALGSAIWGLVVDRLSAKRPVRKLPALALLCALTVLVFLSAFGPLAGTPRQWPLILLGGLLMTCTVGVVAGVAMDVIHPGYRSTGAAVLSLFQNLFGLAVGPVLVGMMSDQMGLQQALAIVPVSGALAALAFLVAARSYEADAGRVAQIRLDAALPVPAGAARAVAAG